MDGQVFINPATKPFNRPTRQWSVKRTSASGYVVEDTAEGYNAALSHDLHRSIGVDVSD